MPQENVDSYEDAVDAFNRRDRNAFLALCDPELENIPPRDWPESRPVQGSKAVWDFFVEGNDPWEEGALEITELIEVGSDKILALIRSQVRGRSSGAAVPWSFWHLATVRDGRAIRFEWFTERAEALRAAGLNP